MSKVVKMEYLIFSIRNRKQKFRRNISHQILKKNTIWQCFLFLLFAGHRFIKHSATTLERSPVNAVEINFNFFFLLFLRQKP